MYVFNADALRTRRKSAGLRIEDVAAKAGLSYPYLRSLEDGRQGNPSIAVVVALAAALDCTTDDLLVTPVAS
jgi:transcriptional regulator with XRE-family HTH domain